MTSRLIAESHLPGDRVRILPTQWVRPGLARASRVGDDIQAIIAD